MELKDKNKMDGETIISNFMKAMKDTWSGPEYEKKKAEAQLREKRIFEFWEGLKWN